MTTRRKTTVVVDRDGLPPMTEEYEEIVPAQKPQRQISPLLNFVPNELTATREELTSIGIPITNQIIFYLEILGRNGIGILVSSIVQAQTFIRTFNSEVIQEEYPRFAHYLQLMEQQKTTPLTYWGENIPIPTLTMANPIVGKMRYYVVQQPGMMGLGKYLAIVVFSE
jgi:hypothetical protein